MDCYQIGGSKVNKTNFAGEKKHTVGVLESLLGSGEGFSATGLLSFPAGSPVNKREPPPAGGGALADSRQGRDRGLGLLSGQQPKALSLHPLLDLSSSDYGSSPGAPSSLLPPLCPPVYSSLSVALLQASLWHSQGPLCAKSAPGPTQLPMLSNSCKVTCKPAERKICNSSSLQAGYSSPTARALNPRLGTPVFQVKSP